MFLVILLLGVSFTQTPQASGSSRDTLSISQALSDSSTYLRAAVVHLEDVAVEELQDVSLSELEADTLETFKDVISAYPELKELQVLLQLDQKCRASRC